MADRDSTVLQTALARMDLLEHGRADAHGVPELLVASWLRSHAAGVDPEEPRSSFSDEIDTDSRLVRCARPVLDRLKSDTADMPLIIALVDNTSRVVERVDCSKVVARLLDREQLAPGFDYSESTMGTNGIGTVFETGQPIDVVGVAHFSESLHRFACSGAPIIDPVTGCIEGALDASTLVQTWDPVMSTLVANAAKEISRNLLLDRSRTRSAVVDTDLGDDALDAATQPAGSRRLRRLFRFASPDRPADGQRCRSPQRADAADAEAAALPGLSADSDQNASRRQHRYEVWVSTPTHAYVVGDADTLWTAVALYARTCRTRPGRTVRLLCG